jgi:hypothetical protein
MGFEVSGIDAVYIGRGFVGSAYNFYMSVCNAKRLGDIIHVNVFFVAPHFC